MFGNLFEIFHLKQRTWDKIGMVFVHVGLFIGIGSLFYFGASSFSGLDGIELGALLMLYGMGLRA